MRTLALGVVLCAVAHATRSETLAAAPSLPHESHHFYVTSDQIVLAMQGEQIPIEGVQIALPAHIQASVAAPALHVEAVTVSDTYTAQLRIACQVRSQCLPFYASARWPNKPGAIKASTIAESFTSAARGTTFSPSRTLALERTLHVGAHTTLLIDQDRLHIRLSVICIQGGAPGDKVRVTTLDRRQNYEAVILDGGELKGTL